MLQREVAHLILLPERNFNLGTIFCPVFDAPVKSVNVASVLLCLIDGLENLALEVFGADVLEDDRALSELGDGASNFFAAAGLKWVLKNWINFTA